MTIRSKFRLLFSNLIESIEHLYQMLALIFFFQSNEMR